MLISKKKQNFEKCIITIGNQKLEQVKQVKIFGYCV